MEFVVSQVIKDIHVPKLCRFLMLRTETMGQNQERILPISCAQSSTWWQHWLKMKKLVFFFLNGFIDEDKRMIFCLGHASSGDG